MAKKGKKKGKDGRAQSPAWVDQMLTIVSAPILREIVAAGLVAAAAAISQNESVRRGARRGARKAREVAGEAGHEAEELGSATKRLLTGDDARPRRAAKSKRPKRNGGATSARAS